ncbi:MAG: YtxH domain-containing protein [Cyanobacteriota bacterium]
MSTESDGYISFGVGLVFGMGIGAALGLLLAPKSGNEIRTNLKNIAHDLPGNLNQTMDDTKDKCESFIDKTRYSIEKKFSKIDNAIRAGKMAAAKQSEELEEELGY